MAILAMWFQETYVFSSGHAKLLTAFVGLVAVAMVIQALVLAAVAVKMTSALKSLAEMADDLKVKLLPLIDTATDVAESSQDLLRATAPKMKTIADNLVRASDMLVETSDVVRNSAQQFDQTITDANRRTQRQVARIDGMVTSALTTTAEIVDTIQEGIRVPAQKVAAALSQVRYGVEGLLAKIKAGSPFGNG
jgi:methyl-accepting chemotaxis protein